MSNSPLQNRNILVLKRVQFPQTKHTYTFVIAHLSDKLVYVGYIFKYATHKDYGTLQNTCLTKTTDYTTDASELHRNPSTVHVMLLNYHTGLKNPQTPSISALVKVRLFP